MIDTFTFKEDIKKGNLKSCYIFYGTDEKIIEECINSIVDKVIEHNFLELNCEKFDGSSLESFDRVINACQTLPFMSEKRVVIVYRASFINDNSKDKSKLSGEKQFKNICSYLKQIPKHCILIMYDVFKSKRDKPGRKIYNIDKNACVVNVGKLKGRQFENRVQELFNEKKKNIRKFELRIFCSIMEDIDFGTVKNEVEKLCCYTYGRDITKDDIRKLFMKVDDDDIFDLVNSIANKKVKQALNVLDELLYKGVKISYILAMVERQFDMLLRIKIELELKKDKKSIMKTLKIRSDYAYSIMVSQSKKFTLKQLRRTLDLCLNVEQRIKSLSVDEKTEMELLIINTTAA
jgi:DNA polymerase III subunit delta